MEGSPLATLDLYDRRFVYCFNDHTSVIKQMSRSVDLLFLDWTGIPSFAIFLILVPIQFSFSTYLRPS